MSVIFVSIIRKSLRYLILNLFYNDSSLARLFLLVYDRQYFFTRKDIRYTGATFRDVITLTRDNPEIFPGNFERAVKRAVGLASAASARLSQLGRRDADNK